MLVKTANAYKCSIFFERGDDRINGKSVLSILTLGAAYGTEIRIITDGEDEQAAADALSALFESKFDDL
jgi:phosphocarrier protein